MTIMQHDDWDYLSEKGKKDAARHRKKVDDAIRKSVGDVIAEEQIITQGPGKKKVRIPVRGLKDWRFKHGNSGQGGGVGQGDGKPGDIIHRRPKDGGKKPGDQPGENMIDVEVDIDYLIKIMFEDLGLPWIEEKTKARQLVPRGWRLDTISKKGIPPRLHKMRTMREAVKRSAQFVGEIMDETGCTEDEAYAALASAHGDLEEAIRIIESGGLVEETESESPSGDIYIHDPDLRFKLIEEDVEWHSKAVVIAMMDISGSMDSYKKYLARSMLFWMVQFLRKVYDNVEIRFIIHTTEARLVDEENFFQTMESGGTMCHTAIDKADYLIETEYDPDEWNVYCVYISDGEDFEPPKTVTSIKRLLSRKLNMLSYLEVNPTVNPYGAVWIGENTLLDVFKKTWKFTSRTEAGTEFYRNDEFHFLLGCVRQREHVYPALKHMLFKTERT